MRFHGVTGILLLLLPLRGLTASPAGASVNAELISVLEEALEDDHADIRDAAWILRRSGIDVLQVIAGLRDVLRDPDAILRLKAADILGKLGPEAKDAVPDLSNRLEHDEDVDVRHAAAEALKRIERKT